jgi:uncharacterized protein
LGTRAGAGPDVLLRLLWAALLALLFAAQTHAQALKPVPPLRSRVTDEAGMLTPDQRVQLGNVLDDYERRTGSQIAVLLVASTEPEAIEQYGIRVTDAWKLGRKGVDDGVLLLVARDNPKALRRLRIEAGRGVQGVLTDAQSKRILEDTIAPHFRQNDYYGGLVAGVGAISNLLDQEKFPAPKAQPQRQPASSTAGDGAGGVIFAFVLLVIGIVMIRSVFRPRTGLARPGLARPGRGGQWNDNSATTGFILGNVLGSAADDEQRRRGSSGDGSLGGMGGFGGSGSDSGFSGGGGSFDGGGASGDW